MYLSHFGLAEEPFSVTSDPRFLFLSDSHEEALAHLSYCVEYRKGFAAITGEIGTGKTTLLNTLISRLDKQHSVAFVYQSASSTIELMRYVFKDLGITSDCADRTEYLNRFNDYLLQEMDAGRQVVLVVDEAQNLSIEVLEDLRLISNFEASNRKLVQIILAGQSELGQKLRLPELRQLNQRIAIQYVLQPLGAEETEAYVQHRLKTAGASRVDIFHPKAMKAIFAVTGGVPRLINQVCDTSMLRAFSQKRQVISAQNVHDVVREDFQFRHAIGDSPVKRASRPADTRKRLALLFAVAVIPALVVIAAWWLSANRVVAVDAPGTLTAGEESAELVSTKQALAQLQSELAALREQAIEDAPEETASPAVEAKGKPATTGVASSQVSASQAVADDSKQALPVPRPEGIVAKPGEALEDPANPDALLVRIREGDTIVKIAHRVYSYSDWALVQEIWTLNPQIGNPNLIQAGDLLRIPRALRSDSE